MVNQLILERLFSMVRQYMNDLTAVRSVSFSEYSNDIRLQRFVERTLHIAIEACLDIANHIISDKRFREPEDNRDAFRVLGENKIITKRLQKKLEEMASFRNPIVHSYAKIDNEIVFGILKKKLNDFESFLKSVSKAFPQKGCCK